MLFSAGLDAVERRKSLESVPVHIPTELSVKIPRIIFKAFNLEFIVY
jgi:hypothetical protein